MTASCIERLSPATRAWIREQLGGTVHHVEVMREAPCLVAKIWMSGGQAVVLRQILDLGWLEAEPDLVRHEATILKVLERSVDLPIAVPTVLALDETGDEAGAPSLLTTMLDGAVSPAGSGWPTQLGHTLAAFHRAPIHAQIRWDHAPYTDVNTVGVPPWTSSPGLWERAITAAQTPRDAEMRLIHRDFHPENVLYEGNKVSGVVDWINACHGPTPVDVAQTRINLATFANPELVVEFTEAYVEAGGGAV